MNDLHRHLTRRSALALVGVAVGSLASHSWAQEADVMVWKDPSCGCCGGWVEHLRKSGFSVTVIESTDLAAIKSAQGVPASLQSCHTASIGRYTIEGHVPAHAIRRLLAEKPAARGLAVAGMPIGSPGMEGARPEVYSVMLFGGITDPTLFGTYLTDRPA